MIKLKKVFYNHLITLFISVIYFLSPQTARANAQDLTSTWTQDIFLNHPVANHHSFGYENYIYRVTGSTFDDYEDVERLDTSSQINRNWIYLDSLPQPTYWGGWAEKNDNVYILGGTQYPPQISINNVYLGKIVDDNINWSSSLFFLPNRLSKGASTISGDYIYFSGGWTDYGNDSSASMSVYFSHINSDGSLSQWSETTPLPVALWGHGMVSYSEYVYLIGGENSSGIKSSIYRAKVNTGGTLSNWELISNLPVPDRNFGYTLVDNYIFIAGGRISGGTGWTNQVFFTTIDNQGNMAPWQISSNVLPTNNNSGSLTYLNGYLYLTGGVTSPGTYTNAVYKSKLNFTTPTPSPSPAPIISLNVPDIKQYSLPWANDIYDHLNGNIKEYGCSLTSASMVLNYFGFTQITPKTLNNWLNSVPDGYIRNGLINWLAITRYTYENKTLFSPALEYRRLQPTISNIMDNLRNGNPSIIDVSGHFVVTKSQLISGIGINDPSYDDRPTLDYYQTTKNLHSYHPTHTDLSYILLVSDGDKEIRIWGPDGAEIQGYTYLQEPIANDVAEETTGKVLRIFEYPTPTSGNYPIKISGNGSYQVDSYIYNQKGAVKMETFTGNVSSLNPKVFNIEVPLNDKQLSDKQQAFVNNKYRVINQLIFNGEYTSAIDVSLGLLKKIMSF